MSDAGVDPAQSVSPATRAHAQACDHVDELLRSFDVENDAVLADQDAANAQQAGTLASLLEVRGNCRPLLFAYPNRSSSAHTLKAMTAAVCRGGPTWVCAVTHVALAAYMARHNRMTPLSLAGYTDRDPGSRSQAAGGADGRVYPHC